MRYRRLLMVLVTVLASLLLIHGRSLAAEKKVTRYVRFQAGETIAYGIVQGDRVRQLEGDLFGSWKPTDKTHQLSAVKLLVPSRPTKVLACAHNYRSHGAGKPPPAEPQLFFKVPSCLIAHGENVVIPKGTSAVHYEAEIVVVIGKRAKNVPKDRALDYVLGVTCGNDISARDWQAADIQWWRAKGSDTFGPCGPQIVSGINYDDLLVQLRQNGQVRQEERTSQMIFSVAEIVSFVSRHCTLEPGDLIFTGTSGKTTSIQPGDVLEVEVEGIGILRNRVTAAG